MSDIHATPTHILGLDPGSRVMGYAVLRCQGREFASVDCGVLRLHETQDHSDRLERIFELVTSLITEYHPTAVAVETPVYGKDPLAMLKLGRAQAACMLAATLKKLPVIEYYPKMVKKSVTGNGNATKDQVAFMLRKTISISDDALPKDATDALAVAWCHYQHHKPTAAPIPVQKRRKQDKVNAWADFVTQNPDRILKP